MRPSGLAAVVLVATSTFAAEAGRRDLAGLPLAFIPNAGQTHPDVLYHIKGQGTDACVTRDGIVYVQAPDAAGAWSAVRMRFEGARPDARVEPLDRLPGLVSFHLGSDPANWRAGLPTWESVAHRGMLHGVDVVWSGKGGRLKSDIVLAPGVDASVIRLVVEGAECVSLGADGSLHLGTRKGDIVERPPIAWQRGAAAGPVKARFVMLGPALVGFEIEGRDAAAELVIDPVLDFATFLGGSADDGISAIAGAGTTLHVAGRTRSPDFPTSAGAYSSPFGSWDAFVAEIDLAQSSVLRCTYFGGGGDESVVSVNRMSILGTTTSADLPLAGSFWDGTLGGSSDVFWAIFDGDTLETSTYWGGSGEDVALGGRPGSEFCGRTTSPDLPTMLGARPPYWIGPLQSSLAGPSDGFIAVPGSWGHLGVNEYLAATYLGGSDHDEVTVVGWLNSLDVDGMPVAGRTWSADYPTHASAHDRSLDGPSDAFFAVLQPSGMGRGGEDPVLQRMHRSTLLGGSGDEAPTAFVNGEDAGRDPGLVGWTDSSDFPLLRSVMPGPAGGRDAFVSILDGDLADLTLSSLFGGSGDEGPVIGVGSFFGHATLAFTTTSSDLPLLAPIQSSLLGPSDVFAATLNLASIPPRLEWSSYLGGTAAEVLLAAGSDGSCLLLAGATSSADLPLRRAIQPGFAGAEDGFAARVCESDVLGRRPVEEVLPDIAEQLGRIEDRIEACDCASLHAALASLQASAAAAAEDHERHGESLDEIAAALAELAARLDALESERRGHLEREIERALFARDCMPWLWLPQALGGELETALDLVERRLEAALTSGSPGVNERVARARLTDATSAAPSDPQRACRMLSDALHALTMP